LKRRSLSLPFVTVCLAAATGACSTGVKEVATTTTASSGPTALVTYTSGEASVTASGGSAPAGTFDAPLDEGAYDPSDEMELKFRASDGKGLLITWRAGQSPEADDAFVRVDLSAGVDGWYPDAIHTQCDVTVTQFTEDSVEGSIECKDLPGGQDQQIGQVEATFSAST